VSSITLSWEQSGAVDNYIIEYNNTNTSSVDLTGVGSVNVSATVRRLPTSGAYYCISVTAVSGHLYSDKATLCSYTGEQSAAVIDTDCWTSGKAFGHLVIPEHFLSYVCVNTIN